MTNNTLLTSPKYFEIDGKFDSERIKEGNIVPLMTGDGQRVNASVVEIKPDVVVVDLNHPLAGADLIFEGEILESRPATTKNPGIGENDEWRRWLRLRMRQLR